MGASQHLGTMKRITSLGLQRVPGQLKAPRKFFLEDQEFLKILDRKLLLNSLLQPKFQLPRNLYSCHIEMSLKFPPNSVLFCICSYTIIILKHTVSG